MKDNRKNCCCRKPTQQLPGVCCDLGKSLATIFSSFSLFQNIKMSLSEQGMEMTLAFPAKENGILKCGSQQCGLGKGVDWKTERLFSLSWEKLLKPRDINYSNTWARKQESLKKPPQINCRFVAFNLQIL